jgi:C4-dicarboxylate-specific signal transduction histidine kinase
LERDFHWGFLSMTEIRQNSTSIAESSTHRVVRYLGWRYLFVLSTVAALMAVDQAVIQPMLVRVNAFAPAINVAGRQRMLSQKLTKAALALRETSDQHARDMRLDELRQSLQQWTKEHHALLEGDRQLGIRPVRTAELEQQWTKLEPHYQAMVAAASDLIHKDPSVASRADDTLTSAVSTIVAHETNFLPTMDRIVKLMEDEAARAVARLRAFALAIAAVVVVLLVGLGWFVVRPATHTIRVQVDQLESRVAQRTSELTAALESLQHEVHERESAERNNQRLSAQLTHAGRVTTMGHLTAGLAHELNQPLAAIANYTEACDVLLDKLPHQDDMSRVREYVVQARQAALRAGQIVRRMRNFVRPNAAAATDVRINDLVTEIVLICHSEAANAGTAITLNLSDSDEVVSADPTQIQQVLVNLVQNSLQAMHSANCRCREVNIRTSTVDGFALIEVLDSGPGFLSDDPEVVFAHFHTTKPDGLGIGLSICRSIVENHRGTIWTESRPGSGALVSFTLPLAAKHAHRSRSQPDCVCC